MTEEVVRMWCPQHQTVEEVIHQIVTKNIFKLKCGCKRNREVTTPKETNDQE